MSQIFTNNASSLLATALTASALDVVVEVSPGEGALFPAVGVGEFFMITIEDAAGNLEICRCTSRTSDELTVERAQENTSLQAWDVGDRVECRLTAGTFDEFLQLSGGTLTGDLDLNGNSILDPVIDGGFLEGVTMRGSDGGTGNQLVVPAAGGAPTIGGQVIWEAGNDGPGSGLNADLLDGQHASYFEGRDADASLLTTGTVAEARLPTDVAMHDQKNVWTAGEYTAESNPVQSGGTVTINCDLSNVFDVDITANVTTISVTNFDNGQQVTILFRQDSPARTVVFPATWRWKGGVEGVITPIASAHDIVTLMRINSVTYAAILNDFATA